MLICSVERWKYREQCVRRRVQNYDWQPVTKKSFHFNLRELPSFFFSFPFFVFFLPFFTSSWDSPSSPVISALCHLVVFLKINEWGYQRAVYAGRAEQRHLRLTLPQILHSAAPPPSSASSVHLPPSLLPPPAPIGSFFRVRHLSTAAHHIHRHRCCCSCCSAGFFPAAAPPTVSGCSGGDEALPAPNDRVVERSSGSQCSGTRAQSGLIIYRKRTYFLLLCFADFCYVFIREKHYEAQLDTHSWMQQDLRLTRRVRANRQWH